MSGPEEFAEIVEFLRKERDALKGELKEAEAIAEHALTVYQARRERARVIESSILNHNLTIGFLKHYWREEEET